MADVIRLDERRKGSAEHLAAHLDGLAARVRSGEVTGVAIAMTLKTGCVSCERGSTPEGNEFALIAAIQYLMTQTNAATWLESSERREM